MVVRQATNQVHHPRAPPSRRVIRCVARSIDVSSRRSSRAAALCPAAAAHAAASTRHLAGPPAAASLLPAALSAWSSGRFVGHERVVVGSMPPYPAASAAARPRRGRRARPRRRADSGPRRRADSGPRRRADSGPRRRARIRGRGGGWIRGRGGGRIRGRGGGRIRAEEEGGCDSPTRLRAPTVSRLGALGALAVAVADWRWCAATTPWPPRAPSLRTLLLGGDRRLQGAPCCSIAATLLGVATLAQRWRDGADGKDGGGQASGSGRGPSP